MSVVCRFSSSRALLITVLALLTIVAACGNENGSEDDAATDPDDAPTNPRSSNDPAVAEDAPDPVQVETDEIEIIDEWQEAGVPRFRDGEVLDFEPHASLIENGGTLLLDGVNASSEEVIGFYRGALTALGWQERRVGDREMTAESDVASLLVVVNEYEDQTLIMMILTDNLRSD